MVHSVWEESSSGCVCVCVHASRSNAYVQNGVEYPDSTALLDNPVIKNRATNMKQTKDILRCFLSHWQMVFFLCVPWLQFDIVRNHFVCRPFEKSVLVCDVFIEEGSLCVRRLCHACVCVCVCVCVYVLKPRGANLVSPVFF